MMIELKEWSEFMFDFWKLIKKHQKDVDFEKLVTDVDVLSKKYPQNLFRGFLYGFLEQKSIEAIREEQVH